MQYLIYFAVATPLVLAGLLWASAVTPPQPPLFHTFADTVYARAQLKREAEERAAHARQATLARARRAAAEKRARRAARAAKPRLEHTARAEGNPNIKLR